MHTESCVRVSAVACVSFIQNPVIFFLVRVCVCGCICVATTVSVTTRILCLCVCVCICVGITVTVGITVGIPVTVSRAPSMCVSLVEALCNVEGERERCDWVYASTFFND